MMRRARRVSTKESRIEVVLYVSWEPLASPWKSASSRARRWWQDGHVIEVTFQSECVVSSQSKRQRGQRRRHVL